MAQPLLATARVELHITVSGLLHKLRAYVGTPVVAGGDFAVPDRNATNIQVADVAQGLWDAVRSVYSNAVGPASAFLQTLSGALWLPTSGYTLTGNGSVVNPTSQASQLTLSMRDVAFKRVRMVILEHSQEYVGHSDNGSGMGSPIAALVADFNGAAVTSGFEPYLWLKSRGNRYLLASGTIAGVTLDTNDKVRRARNIT